jgi:hypothetical protein
MIADLYGPERRSLPDDVLIEIFHFCRISVISDLGGRLQWCKNWHQLVHVCQRWRFVIFGSPLGLNLQILCTAKVPARKLLNVWPALPLHIYFDPKGWNPKDNSDNLIAALEHPDRVREVDITSPPDSLCGRILAVMQEPFPVLTRLSFRRLLHLPGTFLNGSTPCLEYLFLSGVSFPSLPRLLLSATDLTSLNLNKIPNIGYIPPETMATSLPTLTRLESLTIAFDSLTPHPKRRNRRLPPPTRSVLPALTWFDFQGVSEYLEVLAGRIDVPQLEAFRIIFFNQLVIDIPQTIRFLSHPEWVWKSRPSSLEFDPTRFVSILFFPDWSHSRRISRWSVGCQGLDWQVSSAAQICSQIIPLSSGVEGLEIKFRYEWDTPGIRPDEMDPTLWLDIFRSFPSVRRLKTSTELEPFIAAALQRLTASGNSAPDVFPSLESLSIDTLTSDKVTKEGIESFVTARQHSGRPVNVHRTQSTNLI